MSTMFIRCVCFTLLIFGCFIGPAYAQDIRDYARIGPVPSWVTIQSIPDAEFLAASDLMTSYKLASYQDNIGKSYREKYRHFVFDMLTTGSIEDNGTLSFNLDPEYEILVLHYIRTVRAGVTTDLLDLDDFQIYRSETDREKLVFNGTMTASLALRGLQTGDRLDYAYSIIGKNPALVGGYSDIQTQEYSIPTQRLFAKLVIGDGLAVNTAVYDGGTLPVIERLDDRTQTVTYARDDVPASRTDDDRPSFTFGYPVHITSSYQTWGEVGNVFAPYYPRSQSKVIQDIAAEIRAEHSDVSEQARAALDYVQSNIRYLALSMGDGGFIPNSPELILERRYGDCKDVTHLLLSILTTLGINADPLLVDTAERKQVFDFLPQDTAFNHIVVIADIGEKSYVMDATADPQLGDLENYDQFRYGTGLRLIAGASKVVELEETTYEYLKDFEDVFDLKTDPDTISFTATSNYYGQEADSTAQWVASQGMATVEKRYLDYYRDFYPTIEISVPTDMVVDKDNAHIKMTSVYTIPKAWTETPDENKKMFNVNPYELRADFPSFSGADRSTPIKIGYPANIRQTIKVIAPESMTFENDKFEHDSDAFIFTEVNNFDASEGIYTETYRYITKQDHIKLEDVKTDMAVIDTARNRMGINIRDYIEAPKEESDYWWAYLVVIPIWIFFALKGRRRKTNGAASA